MFTVKIQQIRFIMVLDINKIHLGECLELMKEIPDQSINMILCDLPYGTSQNKWDIPINLDDLWEQYRRIVKKNAAIVLTAIQPFASQLVVSNFKWFKYDLIWKKNKSSGFLNANKMPLRQHESILVFYQKMPTYNPQKTFGHKPVNSFTKNKTSTNYGKIKLGLKGGGQTDRHPTSVLEIPVLNNDSKERIHPTQKPVELFEWLIKTYTNENELVLDNCAGSMTTAVACNNTKRNWICIENDPVFCEAGLRRLENQNGHSSVLSR